MSTTDQAIDAATDAVNQAKSTASDLVGKAQDLASDYAGRARDVASDYAGRAKDAASDYAGRAKDAAGQVADQARGYASAAKSKASDLAHSVGTHPLTDTTAKIPTEAFIVAAGASIAGSLVLKFLGRQKDADFVGHWAPTLISLGLLSKLIEHTRQPSHTADRTPSGENL